MLQQAPPTGHTHHDIMSQLTGESAQPCLQGFIITFEPFPVVKHPIIATMHQCQASPLPCALTTRLQSLWSTYSSSFYHLLLYSAPIHLSVLLLQPPVVFLHCAGRCAQFGECGGVVTLVLNFSACLPCLLNLVI